jgi:hypothetical protein
MHYESLRGGVRATKESPSTTRSFLYVPFALRGGPVLQQQESTMLDFLHNNFINKLDCAEGGRLSHSAELNLPPPYSNVFCVDLT